MFETTQRRTSPSGAVLAYHHEPARIDAIGVLVICHGLAEHSRRYRPFAESMAGAGFHTYAHDHRGHGETTAEDATLGRFAWKDGVRHVIHDTKAMRDFAAMAHPGLPILLFGHSMGGLIALNVVETYPTGFDALAIWNSNFYPGVAGRVAEFLLKAERALKGSDVPSTLLPKLTFATWNRSIGENRTDFDWLSRDHAAVDAYVADPLCGFDASVSLWLDIFELSFQGVKPERLAKLPQALPVHLVGGGCDPATNNGQAIKLLARQMQARGMTGIDCNIDPAMRHETLNEVDAVDAVSAFAAWATRVMPGVSPNTASDWE